MLENANKKIVSIVDYEIDMTAFSGCPLRQNG